MAEKINEGTALRDQLTTDTVNTALERCGFVSVDTNIAQQAIYSWIGTGTVPRDLCEQFAKSAMDDVPSLADCDELDFVIIAAYEAADILWGHLNKEEN